MGYRRLVLGLVLVAGGGAGCGSSGATWRTWYSGSCDTRFDMPGLPVSQRQVQQDFVGNVAFTLHGVDIEDTRYVYSCRQIGAGNWDFKDDITIAREVVEAEATAGFDQKVWKETRKEPRDDKTMALTLTDKDERAAEIRVITDRAGRLVHATLTVGITTAKARKFVEAVVVRPRGAKAPITVRSAECLSQVVMPSAPSGTFDNGAITHIYAEPGTGRVYQLRCVYMPEDLAKKTPAEIFAKSQADTEVDKTLVAQGHKDIEVGGRYGRDLAYHTTDGVSQLVVRMIVDGERLQIATFKGPIGDDATAKAFLGTLQVLAPKLTK